MIQQWFVKLSAGERKLFYGAAAFLLLAVIDRSFWGPVRAQLKQVEERIRHEEGNIRQNLRLLAYKKRILEEQDVFSSYFIQKVSSEEEIIAEFLKKIEIMATEANINLIKVTPSEGKQRKGFKEYLASLECAGNMEQLIKFLHLIDGSKDLLRTSKLALLPKKGSETNEVNATMAITKVLIDPLEGMPMTSKKNKTIRLEDLGIQGTMNVPVKMESNVPPEPNAKPKRGNVDAVKFSQD